MKDPYIPIVSEEKKDKRFNLLTNNELFSPAKNIIRNIMSLMKDKDGNFIEQFQSQGFSARLWEIYLHIFLIENEFNIIDTFDRPDFHVKKNGNEIFIEASLSNEKDYDPFSKEFIKNAIAKQDMVIQTQLIDYYVMRMGSVLFSKLNKRYWDLDWVKGKPIILAITPAHNYIASFLPDAKIIEYLYGIKKKIKITETGPVDMGNEIVTKHHFGDKIIPSNYFSQPLADNISAIIFTNNSDLHKFNRMGYQSKLSDEELIIIRSGAKYNPVEGLLAQPFRYQLKPGLTTERWSESLSVFHNPNAIVKIDKSLFKNVRQIWLDPDGSLGGTMTNDFVYHSLTVTAKFE